MLQKIPVTPWVMRWLLNIYPPYRGAGIKVVNIADNWKHAHVELRATLLNRNYVGTHFGGSLFAMTDPFYMLLLMKLLGPRYVVWDAKSTIEFVRPGRGTVTARFLVDDDTVENIRSRTAGGEKHLPEFTCEVIDAEGAVVARVRKTLYVRLKRSATSATPIEMPDVGTAAVNKEQVLR